MPRDAEYQLATQSQDGATTVVVAGRVEVENAQRLLDDIRRRIPGDARQVRLDLSDVSYFDSGGGAVLVRLRRDLADRGVGVEVTGSNPRIDGFLSLVDDEELLREAPTPPPPAGLAVRLGEAVERWRGGARDFASFTGEMVLGLWQAIRHPGSIRWRETWIYMQRTGRDGLPIVALISFLMGMITAFQAAIQLVQFGADIYVANLVGLSITRELGPLMTAIIAAGRSGAAFAAEIGTMKVSEEVDALEAMGLDRTRFLVTPKILALVLMLPCLTLFADLVGILGGLAVAVFDLGLPTQVYFRQMRLYMVMWDVTSGLVKSVVFATLIATIGCFRGFQAREGAESVGQITTSSIVSGIFAIIAADAVFTVMFNDW